MKTLPTNDPKAQLKRNILWLIGDGQNLDIMSFYEVLSKMRDMPHGKDKYRGIERALEQLEREGWPINKHVDHNGVAWYAMGERFTKFLLNRFMSDYESFLGTLDYAKRPDVQIKENLKENTGKKLHFYMPEITTEGGKIQIPLKLVPYVLKTKKEDKD